LQTNVVGRGVAKGGVLRGVRGKISEREIHVEKLPGNLKALVKIIYHTVRFKYRTRS